MLLLSENRRIYSEPRESPSLDTASSKEHRELVVGDPVQPSHRLAVSRASKPRSLDESRRQSFGSEIDCYLRIENLARQAMEDRVEPRPEHDLEASGFRDRLMQ